MKKILSINFLSIFIFSFLILALSSCLKDECNETRVFIQYEAIYVQPEEFRIDINTHASRELRDVGKMYFYNNMVLINEKYEGIHILDNSDPSNPQNIGFIHIPGNLDIAIKDNILYADNYVDLLSIDISDLNNPEVVCRDSEVFSKYELFPNLGYYIYNKPTEIRTNVECSDPNFGSNTFWKGGNIFFAEDALSNNSIPGGISNSGVVGVAGSLARFTLSFDHLYVINDRELVAYDVEDPTKPVKTQTTTVGWGTIETLFPYQEYLFIGGNNGMFIYDASTPSLPQYVSEFRHARACDPVYVKDEIAYVTLRDGTACESFSNQLDVIDISNIRLPSLIKSYQMDRPHGLSLNGDYLFLCEGEFGLKVFKTDDLDKVDENRVAHLKNINAIDAISLSANHLLVIGDDGLYQFDSSNPTDLKEISFVSVSK